MPNVSKPSGAKATGSSSSRFHRAQIRLTLLYLVILAVILSLSGAITYSAFSKRLNNRFNRTPPAIIQLPDGRFIIPSPRDVRADLIWALIIVNGFLLTIGGVFSYWFAGITLDPIEAAYDRQRRFLSDASHELRTPLAILQTTLENNPSAPEHTSQLEEVKRMGRLVSDLLMLSRLDEEKIKLPSTKLSIVEIIHEVIDRLTSLAKQSNITITTDISSEVDTVMILGDKELLLRAFSNLIKNSITYNKDGGSIAINATTKNRQVEIAIKDTGIGIAPDNLKKIFDRFYRVDHSRSRASGGSGLGLSIVQSIVRELKGTLSVHSIPGEGTTITVSLPIHSTS